MAFGYGAAIEGGTVAELTRVLVDHNLEIGLLVQDEGTEITVTDLVVRDTQPRSTDLLLGRGLELGFGAHGEATRVLLERNRDLAVMASHANTRLSITDVAIRETLPRACAETVCAGYPNGMGVGSFDLASVTLRRFTVTQSDLCGVQLGRNAEADLSTGVISDNAIGVCLQVDGYDVSRLMDAVLFRDNGATLEATSYPIPDAEDPAL